MKELKPIKPFFFRGTGKWRELFNGWQFQRALDKVQVGQSIIIPAGCTMSSVKVKSNKDVKLKQTKPEAATF